MPHRKANGHARGIEDGIASAMHRAQEGLRQQYHQAEESVRRSPTNALIVASLAGYLMRSVPLGALLGGVIRVFAALLRPALFLYIAAKFYDYIQRQGTTSGEESPEDARQREFVS